MKTLPTISHFLKSRNHAGLMNDRQERLNRTGDPYLIPQENNGWKKPDHFAGISLNSDREETLSDLYEQAGLYRFLADNVSDVIWTADLTGRFTYISPSVLRQRGFPPEKALSQSLQEILTPDSFRRAEEMIEKLLGAQGENASEPVIIELEMYRADGSIIWTELVARLLCDEDGSPTGFIGITRDISERKKAEEALKSSEERFRTLLQHIPSISVQGYGPDGTTRYWNDASEVLYGYSRKEAIGTSLLDLIIPDEMKEEVRSAITYMAETGRPIPATELSLMRKGGQRVSVFSSHAVVQRAGHEPELFCIDIDLTELKKTEEALKEANQKIKLLTSLTRHDIINQINILGLNLDLALTKKDPDSIHQHVALGSEICRRIETIIGFTKEYESFATISGGWQQIHGIIESAIGETESDGVCIENNIPKNLGIYTEPIIHKVFTTLLENAVRHGRTLTIIRFSVQETGEGLVLSCEDDGIGIPDSEKTTIFDHGYGKHTGIGLFLAKEILSITGIRIRETGTYGEGARFEILVPDGRFRFLTEP